MADESGTQSLIRQQPQPWQHGPVDADKYAKADLHAQLGWKALSPDTQYAVRFRERDLSFHFDFSFAPSEDCMRRPAHTEMEFTLHR